MLDREILQCSWKMTLLKFISEAPPPYSQSQPLPETNPNHAGYDQQAADKQPQYGPYPQQQRGWTGAYPHGPTGAFPAPQQVSIYVR